MPVQANISVPVKANRMRAANEKRMLRQVAFTEKVISTSFGELRLLQQHFVLDSNEKKVKAGKSTREGWLRKVLRRDRWRMKMIPVIRPGRVTEEKARVVEMRRLLEVEHSRELVKYVAFPKSVPEQAKKMRMNLTVRRPPRSPLSGRMRHTPTFSDLAIPRPAEMNEVKKVIRNKILLAPR